MRWPVLSLSLRHFRRTKRITNTPHYTMTSSQAKLAMSFAPPMGPYVSDPLIRAVLQHLLNGPVNVYDRDSGTCSPKRRAWLPVGLSSEQLVGRALGDLFPPESMSYVEPFYRCAFAGKSSGSIYRSLTARTVSALAPLPDPSGSVDENVVVASDVTTNVSHRRRLAGTLRGSSVDRSRPQAARTGRLRGRSSRTPRSSHLALRSLAS